MHTNKAIVSSLCAHVWFFDMYISFYSHLHAIFGVLTLLFP